MKSLLPLLLLVGLSRTSAIAKVSKNKPQHNGEQRELVSGIINFADQILNAVPTMPTTPMPTESPTYSAAPSPSPSEIPTLSPTVSMEPSFEPTIAPTVSHQPTNHPTVSSQPSVSPSMEPTDLPSFSPSISPTNFPTRSAQPSSLPSVEPSMKPSLSPSVSPTQRPSSSPSESPTNYPTVSASPTLMYKESLQINTTIPLRGISNAMNATQAEVLESIARYFIQQTIQMEDGAILVTTVQVQSQRVIQLQDGKELVVTLQIHAEYESLIHPDDFNFQHQVQKAFGSNFSLFKSNLLDSEDPFFEPLNPANRHSNDDNDAIYGYVTIIICSVGASVCACLAAYYAIRRSLAEHSKGDKLGSEMQALPNDPVGSNLTEEDVGDGLEKAKSVEIIKVSNGDTPTSERKEYFADEQAAQDIKETATPRKERLQVETIDGTGSGREGGYTEVTATFPTSNNSRKLQQQQQQQRHHAGAMSPNSMEAGTRLGALAESILRSESFGSNRDPPTEASNRYMYAPKPSKGDPSAKYRTATFGVPRRPEQRDDFSSRIANAANKGSNNHSRRDPSVVGAPNFASADINNFFNNRKDPEQRGSNQSRDLRGQPEAGNERSNHRRNIEPQSAQEGRFDRRGLDWPTEPQPSQDKSHMTVNRSNNNRSNIHRREPPPPSPTSSAVSSSINAFLNMVGGTLGAAPLASSPMPQKQEEEKQEKNEAYHEVLQREGLYDVFAPSGALGIVVDTTKDGPAVHSLKQTSPMLGLINPGDLIVGLDEQDTRSMTAATLTRLMASKSNQKERKITLLAADY